MHVMSGSSKSILLSESTIFFLMQIYYSNFLCKGTAIKLIFQIDIKIITINY